MFLVGSDNFADQFVADDVGVLKANESNSFHGSESLDGFDEARFFAVGFMCPPKSGLGPIGPVPLCPTYSGREYIAGVALGGSKAPVRGLYTGGK